MFINTKKYRHLSDAEKLCIIGVQLLQWIMLIMFVLFMCIDWDMTLNNLGF